MDFRRYDGETEEQLLYRIGQMKDELGYSWQEVADVMNDLLDYDYSESKYRKQFCAFKKMLEANEDIFSDDDGYKEELNSLKHDIKSERLKLQTLNLERNRLDREEARHELFYEQIGQYIQSREVPKLAPLYNPRNKNMKYLLGIADIHANAKWRTNTNEYSMDIVSKRLMKLLVEVIQFVKEKELDELNIVLLGDLIDGCLRMSNLQTMDSTVAKSVADISDMLIGFLETLVERTHIHINLFTADSVQTLDYCALPVRKEAEQSFNVALVVVLVNLLDYLVLGCGLLVVDGRLFKGILGVIVRQT